MLLWTCFLMNSLLGECYGGPQLRWRVLSDHPISLSNLLFARSVFSGPSQLTLHYDAECYAYVIIYLFRSFLPKTVPWLPAASILLLDEGFSPFGRMLNCCVCTWFEIESNNYRSEIVSWWFCPFPADDAPIEVLWKWVFCPINTFFRRANCVFALRNCLCRHFVCSFMCVDFV